MVGAELVKYQDLPRHLLKKHAEITERWTHDRIVGNLMILGQGNMVLKDAKSEPVLELKNSNLYAGIAMIGYSNILLQFCPQKNALRVEIYLSPKQEIEATNEAAGLDTVHYTKRWGCYRLRLDKEEVAKFYEVHGMLMWSTLAEDGQLK